MDGHTPTIEDLKKLMNEIEGDMTFMPEHTKRENRNGLMYVRWLLSELGVEA
jgi:hypothetical protein